MKMERLQGRGASCTTVHNLVSLPVRVQLQRRRVLVELVVPPLLFVALESHLPAADVKVIPWASSVLLLALSKPGCVLWVPQEDTGRVLLQEGLVELVALQGSKVRPNFSMVRLKKI
ncbi:unnamed protein product [Arctogadus glacialis]